MGTIPNQSDNILFSAICREKRGTFERVARALPFDKVTLAKIVEKARTHPTLMGTEINTTEDIWRVFIDDSQTELASKGLLAVVDDFTGIFWLTDIQYPQHASVHYTFFDGVQRGREALCKEALKYIFNTYKFDFLWTTVPLWAKHPLFFVERIGFQKIKREPKKASFFGELYDVNIYEIRPENL